VINYLLKTKDNVVELMISDKQHYIVNGL
jgi:hypothetical protein